LLSFCPVLVSNDETNMEPLGLLERESKSLLIDEDIEDKSDSTPSSNEEELENRCVNVSLCKLSLRSNDLLRSRLYCPFWLEDDEAAWGWVSDRDVLNLFEHDSTVSFYNKKIFSYFICLSIQVSNEIK